jgi:hypothetical protein
MTTLREAAQQALEVLIRASSYYDTYAEIDALRAALEQHEKDVEWMKQRHANWRLQKELAEQTQERDRQQREYEETRSAALEQPEQEEPVAWLSIDCIGERYLCFSKPLDNDPVQPLYTRREWRGLSEEEINEATFHPDGCMNTHIEFARAIEAALKEKNHE